jgi:hypothetical protein
MARGYAWALYVQGLDLPGRQVLPSTKLGVGGVWSAQLFDLLRLARPARGGTSPWKMTLPEP